MTTSAKTPATVTPPPAPRVLFLALANNIGCERVIGAMAAHGSRCAVLSPPGFYCQMTCAAHSRFLLPPQCGIWLANTFVYPALEVATRAWRPDLVIPLDDVAASLLRGLATSRRTSRRLRGLLVRSMGNVSGYRAATTRAGFQELAERIGVRIPTSRAVDSASAAVSAAAGWNWPVVVKIEGTCGGCGVSLVSSAHQLKAAVTSGLDHNSSVRRAKSTLKQLVWRAAGHVPTNREGIQVQQFVAGRPAMRTVACWEGRELAGISFRAECVHPEPTGSSTVLTPLDLPEMAAASRRLVAALGASGILSFDFVIEDGTGHAFAIEMNPRPIGATHLGRLFGHDVCAALLSSLGWISTAEFDCDSPPPSAIAVFPKELERSPASIWINKEGTLHDVPWNDPGLVDAYIHRLCATDRQRAPSIRNNILENAASGPARVRHRRVA